MKFLRLLSIDLQQVFTRRLTFAVIITFVIYSFAGVGFVNDEYIDIWYIVKMAVWGSTAFFTLYTIPAFVFSPALATDWQSGTTRYWIIRTGSDSYTLSKMFASAVAGFLTHFIATTLLMTVLAFKLPLFVKSSTTEIYEDLMQEGYALSGIILYIADRSLKAVVAAEIGMVVSVFFTHPYVAIAAPLGVILTGSRLFYKFHAPAVLDLAYWDVMPVNTVGESIIYKFLLTLFYTILFSCIAVYGMRRKIAHE